MYIFYFFLIVFIISLLTYILGRWKFRKKSMKGLAVELGLTYSEKDEIYYSLSGIYQNRNIRITEIKTPNLVNAAYGSAKLTVLHVDDVKIFSKEGDILLPLPSKIKKIIDNYIEDGIVPKKHTALKWIVVAILFVLLIISQIYMRTKF